jgi:hypothetical protein
MFDNIQHEEEWHCRAAIDERTDKAFKRYVGQDKKSLAALDRLIKKKGLVEEYLNLDYQKTFRSHWTYCHIKNDTAFCKKCAAKLKFKCPVCGGLIAKTRDKDGYLSSDDRL